MSFWKWDFGFGSYGLLWYTYHLVFLWWWGGMPEVTELRPMVAGFGVAWLRPSLWFLGLWYSFQSIQAVRCSCGEFCFRLESWPGLMLHR